jgi:hypothetical protein
MTRDCGPYRGHGAVCRDGAADNDRYRAVRRYARQNGIRFVVPEQVYDELTDATIEADEIPVDSAIEEGWVRTAEPVDYSESSVSRAMDGVQRYIANADDRSADEIERADPALAGVAAQAFADGTVDHAYIYTTDVLAGRGADTVGYRHVVIASSISLRSIHQCM